MAQKLIADFNGQVPDNLDDLTKLPGVGRKTANVIQAVVFNKATMAVDTHVFRVSHRIGLVSERCTTPFSVEKEQNPGNLLHMEHGDGRKKRKEVICTSAVGMHVENYRTIQT